MLKLIKNIKAGKIKIFTIVFFLNIFFVFFSIKADQKNIKFIELNILDKVSSKNSELILKIGEETKFENLLIKSLILGPTPFIEVVGVNN